MTEVPTRTTEPIAALAGADCGWCGATALRRGTYKGDRAMVCEDCGTPALRLF
jgi:hypothetical protein